MGTSEEGTQERLKGNFQRLINPKIPLTLWGV
jgi:hypothetical protein